MPALLTPTAPPRSRFRTVLITLVVLAAVGLAAGTVLFLNSPTSLFAGWWSVEEPTASAEPAEEDDHSQVHFPESRWEAAGVRVEPASFAPLNDRVWRTGRLTLNEDRVSHISPRTEGVVREVRVRLGQDVKAGDILAVIDSREFGQGKLDLVRNREALAAVEAQHEWIKTVSRNTEELVAAMNEGVPMGDLEVRFKGRPIGDWREKLMTAYSRKVQTRAQFDATRGPEGRALSESVLLRIRSDCESANATCEALLEEVQFQARQQLRSSEQKLRDARTSEAMGRTHLLMLGFTRAEVDAMDPLAEGEMVSLYPVRAPFAGTVIDKHAVLSERVSPEHEMFRIADLSTLWLQVDVYEADLPLVRHLTGSTLEFRASGSPTVLTATVFYTGDEVNPETRAVALTASVPNVDRALKPGQFVEAALPRSKDKVVQAPAAAVQRHGGRTFVFVYEGDAVFRPVDVTVGRSSGEVMEITSGLKAGQPIATAGGFVLKSELFRDQLAGD